MSGIMLGILYVLFPITIFTAPWNIQVLIIEFLDISNKSYNCPLNITGFSSTNPLAMENTHFNNWLSLSAILHPWIQSTTGHVVLCISWGKKKKTNMCKWTSTVQTHVKVQLYFWLINQKKLNKGPFWFHPFSLTQGLKF